MLRKFTLRRKIDTGSSVESSTLSIFDNAPYRPDSVAAEYPESPCEHKAPHDHQTPEKHSCGSDLHKKDHIALEEQSSKSPSSATSTHSLVHHSPPSKSGGPVSKHPEEFSLLTISSKNMQVIKGNVSAKSPTLKPSSRRSSAGFNADVSALPRNLRHTPSVRTVATSTSFLAPQDTQAGSRISSSTDRDSRSRDYLKIKLTFTPTDETLALKYLRHKLTNIGEFVDAVNSKLIDRYQSKHGNMAIFLTFSDKSLKKVLLSGAGSPTSRCIEPLTMDYIRFKSRIYLEVCPA